MSTKDIWLMKWLLLILAFPLTPYVLAQDLRPPPLSPEDLENYQFETRDTSSGPIIEALSVGQKYLLDKQRREIKDLIARKLGILSLEGDKSDLSVLQALYDRRAIRDDQLMEWQAAGVMFGDILVEEFGLHWISYEDELGASKALQWQDTRNFVFPITVFSKRLGFGEKLDVEAIYQKIKADIEAFKDYEQRLGR